MEKRIDKNIFLWVAVFFLGELGVDRFMRGQIVLGILKLITVGGCGLWWLIDLIIAIGKLGKYDKEFVFIDTKWEK
ncbi:hypothetical protein FACS1894200_00990 [Spirochaetia bacterium]|nr:hypothetical protein FACS1894200_00990 [Spirochaetia bacterium]